MTGRRSRFALRLRDLGSLDAAERSKERNRRVGLSAATALSLRGLSLVVGLVTVPLMIRYLGTEEYGLWVTITSFTAFIVFADLGLGQGLVNGLAAALGEDDQENASELVASATWLLTVIAVVTGLGYALVHPYIPWASVLNVATESGAASANAAMAALFAMMLVGLPLSVAWRIRESNQETFVNHFWKAVGSVLSLGALVVVIWLDGSLPWLVLAFMAGPVVTSVVNFVSVLRKRPWLLPRPSMAAWGVARRMLGFGLLFFVIQAAGLASFQTDNVVIARILGAGTVTQYAVPMKLFALVPLFVGFGLYPLWPAYREALFRGDYEWFKQAVGRSWLLGTAGGVVLSAGLVLVARPVIDVWAGEGVDPSLSLLLALGAYASLMSVVTAQYMYCYAVNALRYLTAVTLLLLAVNLGLSIVLTYAVGIPGPAIGSAASLALALVVNVVFIRSSLERTMREGVPDAPAGTTVQQERVDLP